MVINVEDWEKKGQNRIISDISIKNDHTEFYQETSNQSDKPAGFNCQPDTGDYFICLLL